MRASIEIDPRSWGSDHVMKGETFRAGEEAHDCTKLRFSCGRFRRGKNPKNEGIDFLEISSGSWILDVVLFREEEYS